MKAFILIALALAILTASAVASPQAQLAKSCGYILPKSLKDLRPPYNKAHVIAHGISCTRAKHVMYVLFRECGKPPPT